MLLEYVKDNCYARFHNPKCHRYRELKYMFMKNYAPNRCEPSIKKKIRESGVRSDLNQEGGGEVRVNVKTRL